MAEMSDAGNDDVTFTLNLTDLFDAENVKIDEINSEDTPDDVLAGIITDMPDKTSEKNEKLHLSPAVADNFCKPPKSDTKNRFRSLSKEDTDSICHNSIAKKTHRQTNWGLKVFTGEILWQN